MGLVLCATTLIFLNNSINCQYRSPAAEGRYILSYIDLLVRVFVCFRTIVLIALFSQYLTKIEIPVPGYSRESGGFYVGRFPVFILFPVSIVRYSMAILFVYFSITLPYI